MSSTRLESSGFTIAWKPLVDGGEGDVFERDKADRLGPCRRGHRFEELDEADIEILRDRRAGIEEIFVAALIERPGEAVRREKQLLVLLRERRFALHDERAGILEDEIVLSCSRR